MYCAVLSVYFIFVFSGKYDNRTGFCRFVSFSFALFLRGYVNGQMQGFYFKVENWSDWGALSAEILVSKTNSVEMCLCRFLPHRKGLLRGGDNRQFFLIRYSKDEIFRIFHGSVYTPRISEFWEISKFRRKFRYFGVIFFGLHRGLNTHTFFWQFNFFCELIFFCTSRARKLQMQKVFFERERERK